MARSVRRESALIASIPCGIRLRHVPQQRWLQTSDPRAMHSVLLRDQDSYAKTPASLR